MPSKHLPSFLEASVLILAIVGDANNVTPADLRYLFLENVLRIFLDADEHRTLSKTAADRFRTIFYSLAAEKQEKVVPKWAGALARTKPVGKYRFLLDGVFGDWCKQSGA